MKSDESSAFFQIRICESFEDFAACIEMQREVWSFADSDITPLRALIITRNSGGFTLGAFDKETGKMLGFAHALPAFDEKLVPYFYSHMLAVKPELQNSGIGMKLKFAQRRYALQHGIRLMVWTFDPLQSRNAYLNIVKLGAVIRRYKINYYGNYSSSALHRGLDTDRLLVEWWLDSPRVKVVAGEDFESSNILPPQAFVEVPFDIENIKSQNLDEARKWQQKLRTAFQQNFAAGLYCAGFERGERDKPSRYLFFEDRQNS